MVVVELVGFLMFLERTVSSKESSMEYMLIWGSPSVTLIVIIYFFNTLMAWSFLSIIA